MAEYSVTTELPYKPYTVSSKDLVLMQEMKFYFV
jgi:hypothetical protein